MRLVFALLAILTLASCARDHGPTGSGNWGALSREVGQQMNR
jgi:hypothetical protein